ncbi:MAG: hypothetical protein QG656_504, partial [Candidatus Hydrogenedentes bacterium]|nr:hypothetical protein [Candidatus Hydrogenedentota bacterium]
MKLFEKAEQYEAQIRARHMHEGLLLPWLVLPPKGKPDYTTGNYENCAAWSGAYLASLAYRYGATQNEGVCALMKETLAAHRKLRTITGRPGFLARGFKRASAATWDEDYFWHQRTSRSEWHQAGEYRYLGDTSVDQYDCTIFGYAVVHEIAADDEDRALIREEVAALVDHIVDHDMRIVDDDGEMTLWGCMNPALLDDPKHGVDKGLNSLIALALLKTAHAITGEARFDAKYRELIEVHRYHENALKAVNHDCEEPNHSDDNLAYDAYFMLFTYETDEELLDSYRHSYYAMWNFVKPEQNSFFNFCHHIVTRTDGDDAGAIESLHGFPVNRVVDELKGNYDYMPEYEHRTGPRHASQVVPMAERPEHEYQWAMDPYRL